jgi:hypothetical protein
MHLKPSSSPTTECGQLIHGSDPEDGTRLRRCVITVQHARMLSNGATCDCGGWTDRVFANAVLVEAVVELVDGSNDGAIGVSNEVFFVVVVMVGLVGGGDDGVNVCVWEHAWRTGGEWRWSTCNSFNLLAHLP